MAVKIFLLIAYIIVGIVMIPFCIIVGIIDKDFRTTKNLLKSYIKILDDIL